MIDQPLPKFQVFLSATRRGIDDTEPGTHEYDTVQAELKLRVIQELVIPMVETLAHGGLRFSGSVSSVEGRDKRFKNTVSMANSCLSMRDEGIEFLLLGESAAEKSAVERFHLELSWRQNLTVYGSLLSVHAPWETYGEILWQESASLFEQAVRACLLYTSPSPRD